MGLQKVPISLIKETASNLIQVFARKLQKKQLTAQEYVRFMQLLCALFIDSCIASTYMICLKFLHPHLYLHIVRVIPWQKKYGPFWFTYQRS